MTLQAKAPSGNGRAEGAHSKGKDPGPRPSASYAPDFIDHIPPELRGRQQWVVWKYELAPDRGKWTKILYRPCSPADKAASTDPDSWSDLSTALGAYLKHRDKAGRARVDGIGFVFSADDPYVGIDLDNCLDEKGGIVPWAFPYVLELETYAEISPSGRGVKFIARGKLPGKGRRKPGIGPDKTGAVEMYDQGRFFTITGNRLDGSPATVEDVADAVLTIHDEVFPPKAKPSPKANPAAPAGPLPASDEALLDLAYAASKGEELRSLYLGQITGGWSRSEAVAALLCRLAFWTGKDAARMDRMFRASGLMTPKWDEPRGDSTWGANEIEGAIGVVSDVYTPRPARNGKASAAADGPPPPEDEAPPTAPLPRHVIEVNTERHRVLAETLAILPTDPDLFTRGDVLVRIGRVEEDETKLPGGVRVRKALGAVRVIQVNEAVLSCRVTALADFVSWSKDRSGEDVSRPAHPPVWLTAALAGNGVYPGVRPLEGVAETPFPRPDGTIVTEPGYDAETGVYLAPTVEIGPLPGKPTRQDAEGAAKLLLALVEQFPFATPDDAAVWLASLLTVIARPAVRGAVPGTALNANKAGAGKGRLIDVGGIIATGRPVPTSTYPRDEAEAEKTKVAFALAATPIVHLDNLDEGRAYGGGVLDSSLTSLTVNGRILGQSKNTEGIGLRCCWVLSGNNVVPTKDAHRRWLVCNLMTDLERPEERRDLKIPDLLQHVREHRAELVRAALIILRAHAAAGRPTGDWAPLGSFEEWDRVVRGAVWFATGRDCNTTRRKAAEESPDRLNKLALLEAWSELPNGGSGGLGVTSEEAHQLAFGDKDNPARHPALADALVRFSRDGKVATRSIGFIIRGMKGQNLNGMAFKSAGEYKRSALWYVDKLIPCSPDNQNPSQSTPSSGEYGEYGEYDSSLSRAGAERTSDMMTCGSEPAGNRNGSESYSPYSPYSPAAGREVFEV